MYKHQSLSCRYGEEQVWPDCVLTATLLEAARWEGLAKYAALLSIKTDPDFYQWTFPGEPSGQNIAICKANE